jgi:hypothetical protein
MYKDMLTWVNGWIDQALKKREMKATSRRLEGVVKRMQKIKNIQDKLRYEGIIAELEKEHDELELQLSPDAGEPASKPFKINLTGWKYAHIIDKVYQDTIDLANSYYGIITVSLTESPNGQNAFWLGAESTISMGIDLSNEDVIDDAAETLRHEIIHWAQTYLGMMTGSMEFGMPPSNMRTPGFIQSPTEEEKASQGMDVVSDGIFHSLDDSEFHPTLTQIISWIKKELKPISKDKRKDVLNSILGIGPTVKKHDEYNFLASLKEYSPEKWRRAVNEIINNI